MDKVYIREQDFHIATKDEVADIDLHYKLKNRRIWIRLFIASTFFCYNWSYFSNNCS